MESRVWLISRLSSPRICKKWDSKLSQAASSCSDCAIAIALPERLQALVAQPHVVQHVPLDRVERPLPSCPTKVRQVKFCGAIKQIILVATCLGGNMLLRLARG